MLNISIKKRKELTDVISIKEHKKIMLEYKVQNKKLSERVKELETEKTVALHYNRIITNENKRNKEIIRYLNRIIGEAIKSLETGEKVQGLESGIKISEQVLGE